VPVNTDLGPVVGDALVVVVLLLAVAAPIAAIVGIFWVTHRRVVGQHSRFDGLFSGIGRANAMNSHLEAGTPDPDELAVPVPPRPGSRRTRKRRA
jgi:hypothetical protein